MTEAASALADPPQTAVDSAPLTGTRLAEVLQPFDRVIERRNTIPTLECLRLWADGQTLTIDGTDLDIHLSCRLPFIAAKFKTLVNQRSFSAATAAFGDEEPSISMEDEKLVLRGNAGVFVLETSDPDDFIQLVRAQPNVVIDVPAGDLRRLIELCRPAISREETRYYLCGLSFRFREGKLECAATDGHRLHIAKHSLPAPDGEMPQIILPTKATACLAALLMGSQQVVAEISRLRATFLIDDTWTLETKCIDATYPDYDRVLPTEFKGSLKVPASDLLSSLKIIGRMASERCFAVRLNLADLKIGFRDVESGYRFERPVAGVAEGELPPDIGFRASYAEKILAGMSAHDVTIRFSDVAMPIRFDFDGTEDFVAVLMPMRV